MAGGSKLFDVKAITADQTRMEQERMPFDAMRRECAELLLPRHVYHSNLGGYRFNSALSPVSRVTDEHAQQALEQGISLFEGYVIPRGQIWQRWKLSDDDLMKKKANAEWLERKNLQLFALRNDPKSGFTGQTHESIASLLCMGMQSTWPDIRRDQRGQPLGLSYQSEPLAGIYVREDHQGLVSIVHHAFELTAEQAQQRWGDQLPEAVRKRLTDKNEARRHDPLPFLHRIEPNPDFNPDMLDWRGKPWVGSILCLDGTPELFIKGGYRAMPRIVSRFENAPQESYGRCPAFTILPAVRATQQMMMDLMLASELSVMPPLGAMDDMLDVTINYAAREVTYGAIDRRGNKMIQPLLDGADPTWAMGLLDKLHGHIDRAFFVDLLQIRREMKSHVTDAQLYQREEEKGLLLAPLAHQEQEWFSPMLDREIDLMDDMGMLDDMPGEIAEAIADGVTINVIYDNGLTRAQESGAAAGYFRTLEQFAPIFQTDQEAWQIFRSRYPLEKVLDGLARINGIPVAWRADEEAEQAQRGEDIARRDLMDAAQLMPALGSAAEQLAGAVPNAI